MLNVNLNEDERKILIEELLNVLTKENEQKLPNDLTDDDKRWILNNLMLMRTMGYLDAEFINKQDRLLSYENALSGIVKINCFKFKKNYVMTNINITKLEVDALVLFSNNIFGRLDAHFKCLENEILLKAGLQINEDLAFKLKSDNGIVNYRQPYVVEGYNLPAKNIVKVILPNLYFKFSEIEKDKLKENLRNLFVKAKADKWKSMAVELSEFPLNYPKDILKNIIINECKNLNKEYRTKINLVFAE